MCVCSRLRGCVCVCVGSNPQTARETSASSNAEGTAIAPQMRVVLLRVLAALASCVPSAALRLPAHPAVPKVAEAKAFVLAAACSASLLAGAPHAALAAPTLNEAIVEVSQTSYPILKALTAETFVPFSAKIGKLVLDIAPDKLGKSIALRHGQSVPPLRCHSSIRSTGAS